MARGNFWRQIRESTEGPTVNITISRDLAEELMKVLGGALETDDMGDEDEDLDSVTDLNFDDIDDHGEPDEDEFGGPPDGDEDDMDFMAAGDDGDDEMFDEPSPPKKSAGRPPGAKNKKKDDDKEDKKEESLGRGPRTSLGESSFVKLHRGLKRL